MSDWTVLAGLGGAALVAASESDLPHAVLFGSCLTACKARPTRKETPMKSMLLSSIAVVGVCLVLGACGDSGGSGVTPDVRPVTPENQVTPGAANFQNPEQRSN
jgi:hypothetical protein